MVELLQNLLHTLLSPRVVWIVLWTGLAALTVALLVLTRTRWGQARPLTKCIVLSLFAHVLLGGYAYMTNLFYDYPAAPPGESIRISLAEPGPATAENPDRPAQPQPWERFPTAAVTPPVAPELAPRMVDEPDLQPERAPVGQLPTLTDAPPAEPLIDEPAPFSPVESPRIRAERPSSSALDVAEIAVPETKHQPPDDPLQPSQPGLARVEAPQPTEADAPSQPAPELPEELADASSRLQRLADLPLADVDA